MSPEVTVSVKTTEAATVAFVEMQGLYDQMPQGMGKLFGELQKRGLTPMGPPSGVYYNNPMEVAPAELKWEIWAPVAPGTAEAAQGAGGVGVKKVPAMEVAWTLHKGPYDQIGQTYMTLGQWIAENGYEVVGPAGEVYLSDPQVTAPDDLLTEIRMPIRKK